MTPLHSPVLVSEVIEALNPQPADQLLDCTLGHGGHARAYLLAAAGTRVLGIDADAAALAVAKRELAQFGERVHFVEGISGQLQDLVRTSLGGSVQGGEVVPSHFSAVLFDLGIGSHQLADQARGFSFGSPGPLVMRYAASTAAATSQRLPPAELASLNMLEERLGYPPDALDIIRQLVPEQVTEVLLHYGEEPRARQIVQGLKEQVDQLQTAQDVADAIEEVFPQRGKTHPATRTFQALRLAVNRELEVLALALPQACGLLKPNGRLAVISFHSLEDRIVKRFFRQEPGLEVLTKKPIMASREEVSRNVRARSAKLRVAQKNQASNQHTNNNRHTHDSQHTTAGSAAP